MSIQPRKPTGSPASAGGQFAATTRSTTDVPLEAPEPFDFVKAEAEIASAANARNAVNIVHAKASLEYIAAGIRSEYPDAEFLSVGELEGVDYYQPDRFGILDAAGKPLMEQVEAYPRSSSRAKAVCSMLSGLSAMDLRNWGLMDYDECLDLDAAERFIRDFRLP